MRRGIVLVSSLLLLGAGLPESMHVEWAAHEGCPDRNAYWTAVVARSGRIRRAMEGEKAHATTISIVRSGTRSIGLITIDGGPPRKVAAPTCDAVVDALALITVLAIDPGAIEPPHPAPSTSASSAPAASPTVEQEQPKSVPEASSWTPLPTRLVPVPPRPPARTAHLSFLFGGGVFSAGAGPVVMPALSLDFERSDRFSVRLTGARGASPMVHNALGPAARFTWSLARLDGCVPPLALSPALFLRGCAGAEAGVVEGSPQFVAVPRKQSRPWLAPSLASRLEGWLGEASAVELEIAVAAPLFREDFVVDPDYFLFRPAPLEFRAGLALRVRFP